MREIRTRREAGSTYLEAGAAGATPVVFLHGWGGCRKIWAGTLRRCPEDMRFIALDLPGTGDTPLLPDNAFPALAEWLVETARALGLPAFHLVGHSLGGNVAAHAALAAPGRVKSLALVDAALYSDRVARARLCLGPVTGDAALFLTRAGAAALALAGLALRDRGQGGFWRPYLRRNAYVVRHNNHAGMKAQLQALVAHPFDLASVPEQMPVLLMHGKRDSVIPFAFAEEALSSRPANTRLIPYPSAMHCPMDTDPDTFVEDLAAFVRSAERSDPLDLTGPEML